MSNYYNTGNEIGSSDVRDLSDDARAFDQFTNSNEDTFTDRLGIERKTISGATRSVGIPIIGNFTTGCTVTDSSQGVQEVGGSVYRWKGALPKIVPPSSTPAGTGGISPAGDWVDVGDASAYSRLILELGEPNGVDLVGGAAKQSDLSLIDGRVDNIESKNVDTLSQLRMKAPKSAGEVVYVRSSIDRKSVV
jgi:hypothetical protein